jgi:hypothetical protein
MSETPPLHEERVPPGEAELIESFVRHDRAEHERSYPAGSSVRRRVHVKSHGCLHGELHVSEAVPEELRSGLFAAPATYPALVRFSNGRRRAQRDSARDTRGMAIKLFGVKGAKLLPEEADALTQDLLLLNFPSFFASDAADFAALSRAFDRDGHPLRYLLPLNPSRWRLAQAWSLLRATAPVRTPLLRYWSQVPIRCGKVAVQLSALPHLPAPPVQGDLAHPDCLREALIAQLERGPIEYDLCLQLQTDPVRMPIENARVPWSEDLSPPRAVARLHLPQQRFATPTREAYAESLAFTPWHGLSEHRPLGSINRMRRAVYRASAQLRRERAGTPAREPSRIADFLKTAG